MTANTCMSSSWHNHLAMTLFRGVVRGQGVSGGKLKQFLLRISSQ